jgi:hypothetical protein
VNRVCQFEGSTPFYRRGKMNRHHPKMTHVPAIQNRVNPSRNDAIGIIPGGALLDTSTFMVGKVLLLCSMCLAVTLGGCGGDETIVEETVIPPLQVSPGTPGDTVLPGQEPPSLPDAETSDAAIEAEDALEEPGDDSAEESESDASDSIAEDASWEADADIEGTEASLADGMDGSDEDDVEIDDVTSDEDTWAPDTADTEGVEDVDDSGGGSAVNVDLKTCKDGCGADDLECTGVCGGSPLCLAQCAAANIECLDACEAAFGD